jgi:hypothetical protein
MWYLAEVKVKVGGRLCDAKGHGWQAARGPSSRQVGRAGDGLCLGDVLMLC